MPVKQVEKYAEPVTDDNKALTDRFSLLHNNYFIVILLGYTVYLHNIATQKQTN